MYIWLKRFYSKYKSVNYMFAVFKDNLQSIVKNVGNVTILLKDSMFYYLFSKSFCKKEDCRYLIIETFIMSTYVCIQMNGKRKYFNIQYNATLCV